MSDASVIKEFLVSLGFKTDEKSLKNFTAGITGATKAVTGMVAAIEAAALAVGASVAAFASNMDEMYFATKRTESSAANLNAVEYAARSLGASAGEARGAVEGLARFMRDIPGGEGFLASLGVVTRDANGQLRDTSDLLIDLGNKLSAMPWYQAKAYAGSLGISDNMLRAMRDGTFAEGVRQYKKMNAAVDFDGAAEKAHRFQMKMSELEARIKGLGVTIGSSLIDALGPGMEDTARWFEKNGDKVADVVANVGRVIVNLAAIVTPLLGKIAEGWENIYGWVKLAGEKINELMPQSWRDKIGAGTAWLFDKLGITDPVNRMMGMDGQGAAPAGQGGGNGGAYGFFRRMGWSHEQAAGIVANLQAESGMKANAVGDNGKAYGIAQWHPDRQAEFKKWAGKDIRQSSLDEQMAFVHYELTEGNERKAGALLKAAKNAQQAGEIMSRHYERPLAADAEASKRGAAAVQIAQTTNINVTGGDAAATGRAVAGEQGRVNQQLARNLQSAVS